MTDEERTLREFVAATAETILALALHAAAAEGRSRDDALQRSWQWGSPGADTPLGLEDARRLCERGDLAADAVTALEEIDDLRTQRQKTFAVVASLLTVMVLRGSEALGDVTR